MMTMLSFLSSPYKRFLLSSERCIWFVVVEVVVFNPVVVVVVVVSFMLVS